MGVCQACNDHCCEHGLFYTRTFNINKEKENMKIIKASALVAAGLMISHSSTAGEFFIGLNAGQSNFSGLVEACDDLVDDNRNVSGFPVACTITEDSDTTLSINAGYNFNRFFGAEIGYIDLGEYEGNVSLGRINFPITADADLTYAGLVLSAPFTKSFSISARLGAVNGNAEASTTSLSAEFEDETGAFAGVSADFRVTENISVQLRYDDLDLVDITSAGIRYHF